MSTSEGTSHAPGSSSQQDASGSGGIVNNDTTNNHYDNSKGKTIDNSTHDTTYKDSNHIEYKTSIQNNIINTPPAPVDPSVIEILRNRVCAGAAFDSAERADPPRCHPDTRTAILQSGRSWIDALNVVFFFLWITGWAGMGKSAILQTLAEEYQRGTRLAASFFFFQASPDRNTTQGFVATIAYQLMESVPGAREIILQKISNNQTIFSDKSFDGLWRTLIVDTLCTAPPPPAPMLIVIDGVDEIASHDEQRALLHAILKSAEKLSSAHYKILIASRPEQPIEMVFREFLISPRSRIELENSDITRADIKRFLEDSLWRIYSAHNPQSASPTPAWPGPSTIEHLVDKASGQFIYAGTVVRFLGSPGEDPEAALKVIMHGRDVRSESFQKLDYLYLLLMERITRPMEKKDPHLKIKQDLLHRLLVCIYMHLASEVGDQINLLHPEESKKGLLKTLLGKLHPILGPNGEYRHKSFIEFLVLPSAPHLFSINSWHISGVISLCLPVFLEKKRNINSLLCFVERASPTQDLVSCLGKMPKGELSSWNSRAGCKESGYLWDSKLLHQWTLGWLGYDFRKNGVNFTIDERIAKLRELEGVTSNDMLELDNIERVWRDPMRQLQILEQKYGLEKITLQVRRKPHQYLQKSLYLLVGLPYYKWHTFKETSPRFYKTRTYDLAGQDLDGQGSN